ncbi:MAG: class I SAM-dependent methyltransferase [Nocardioidaceae bacterium]
MGLTGSSVAHRRHGGPPDRARRRRRRGTGIRGLRIRRGAPVRAGDRAGPDRVIPRADPRTRPRARCRGPLEHSRGDIDSSLSALASADLVWSSHVVHHTADPVDALRKLGSLLTADGRLAIAEGGLPMRVLPGDYGLGAPGFPARLDATLDEYAVREWGLPEAATGGAKDWPVMFGDAGLVPVQSRTFLLDRPAPLHDTVRAYVVAQFAKVREQVGDRLDRADARALDRLLDASDQVSLIRRPDLFVLSASTVHIAARGSATTAAER